MNCKMNCLECEYKDCVNQSSKLTVREFNLSRQLDKEVTNPPLPYVDMTKYVHDREEYEKEVYIKKRNRENDRLKYERHRDTILQRKKEQYKKNRVAKLAYAKNYYAENSEEIKAKSAEYYLTHKDTINESRRNKYALEKDSINEKRRKQYQENREEILRKQRERYHKRKERKLQNDNSQEKSARVI